METFLVGGAVRDFLLAQQHNLLQTKEAIDLYWSTVEKDWVVVGSTPIEMISKGFRPVGKSFPVFLHPETNEEYALARIEKKVAKGYTGFECYAHPDVTLAEDLLRRDLTMNAIAMRLTSNHFYDYEIIDPYQGIADLKQGIFRHISTAFAEDPVRILRLARFASRFPDFRIAPETLVLMKEMVKAGEVNALVPERVWQEWAKSLKEKQPRRFFEVLQQSSAQEILFPEISISPTQKDALQKIVLDPQLTTIRLAIELANLAPTTVNNLAKKYHIPADYRDLALLVSNYAPFFSAKNWSAEEILTLLEKTDAFRRVERFMTFLKCCDLLGLKQKFDLAEILKELLTINNQTLLNQGLQGEAFAKALRECRLKLITAKIGS